MKTGFVALVGAGPGDPGLLTLRGKELLETADVVIYDRLVSKEIMDMISPKARLIDVGKERGSHPVTQERINAMLYEEALKGGKVIRLKGGDPFVFGRGGEELELICRNGIPFEVVPGITSAVAVPAYAGIPVTHRLYSSSLHIITGHQREGEPLGIHFDQLAKTGGTLVFLMGVSSLGQIAEGLIAAGMDDSTPAAMVQNGTTPGQRRLTATLKTIEECAKREKISSPAVLIVGKVCDINYDWFSRRPLFGTKVIVTRPVESEGVLSRKLRLLGAEVFDLPCVGIRNLESDGDLANAVDSISGFDWLVFTSKNGVRIFFDFLKQRKLDARVLKDIKVAAVGAQTAKTLEAFGILADFIPGIYDGAHLGRGLCELTGKDARMMIFRAENGSEDLPDALRANGRNYADIPVYKTVFILDHAEEIRRRLSEKVPLLVAFTSASCVEGFVRCAEGEDLSLITGICIGPQTAAKTGEYGISHVSAESATIDSMIEKILELRTSRGDE